MDTISRRARELRSAPTDAERALWRALRYEQLQGYKFRRQFVISPYIVDFVCLERRLIIEVDGAHHRYQKEYDRARDTFLVSQRFRVVRFNDREVLTELAGVTEAVLQLLAAPPP